MTAGVRGIVAALGLALVLGLVGAGCSKKPAFSNCKSDGDCLVDATGKEIGAKCYMGKCEECVEDTDCQSLKNCINNRCVATCRADNDCAHNAHCEEGVCASDCLADNDCGDSRVCGKGRCLAQGQMPGDTVVASDDCQNLSAIHFDFDRFTVRPESYDHVKKLANCLKNNPSNAVMISGHTDDRGTPSYNFALGEKRALAVMDYLVQKEGIASARVKTVSFGAQKPMSDDRTETAFGMNRRTEFLVEAAK